MTRRRLALAVERHATSKLADDDLLVDPHAGLSRRGAAVDRRGGAAFDRPRHAARAARLVDRRRWRREVGAQAGGARRQGTRVEVRELFFATPARLKFLKSIAPRREAVREVVRRLAMAGRMSPSRSPARTRAGDALRPTLPGATAASRALGDDPRRRLRRQRGRDRRRARRRAGRGLRRRCRR